MRAVFDLDDTISVHRNRDFENAAPIVPTIERMRHLKEDGWEIVIYSARGQHSCKGDLKLIEERNRAQVERWLERHGVPYDELRFGKPLGDLYIDDKGISLDDFLAGTYERLHGNSGSEIYRAGNTVIKRCENARQQADWYGEARELGINVPEVRSVVLDSLSMEYVAGESGADRKLTKQDIYRLAAIPMLFSLKRDGHKFEAAALIRRAKEHLEAAGKTGLFKGLFGYLTAAGLEAHASFCHGDMSLSNTIFAGKRIYLIDPIIAEGYSSYLMDFAKLRFSLDDGELFLHGRNVPGSHAALSTLDLLLSGSGLLGKVVALEAVFWIRLLKYTAEPERREEVIRKAQELEGDI